MLSSASKFMTEGLDSSFFWGVSKAIYDIRYIDSMLEAYFSRNPARFIRGLEAYFGSNLNRSRALETFFGRKNP